MSKNYKGWSPHLVSRFEENKKELEIDIDPDIEKEIAQLQEAKFSEKIKEINLLTRKKNRKSNLQMNLEVFSVPSVRQRQT